MATSAEMKAKIEKLEVNLGRLDSITNGNSSTEVTIDTGTVPSVAKLFTTILGMRLRVFTTKSALDATLTEAAGVMAVVTEDTLKENNTFYKKIGASGSGSWALFDNGRTPEWKGAWSNATTYSFLDMVENGGNSYISIQSTNLNQSPGSSPSFWQLMAQGASVADGAITTVKLADGAVTPAKISGALDQFSPSWNAGCDIWQRGTTFNLVSGVSQYTMDRTINGPGPGASATVTRQAFAINESVIGAMRNGAPFYHRMQWTGVPSTGEGRTNYPNYYSSHELRHEDARRTAGMQITVSVYLWVASGSVPMYLYAAQSVGAGGAHNVTGNTISGTGAGRDANSVSSEVFHRSAAVIVTTTPTRFTFTVTLDNLASATFNGEGTLTVGMGIDASYGPTLNSWGLKFDYGPSALPYKKYELADLHQYAQRHHKRISSITGITIASNLIEVTYNIDGGFGGSGPSISLTTSTPTFLVGNGTGVGNFIGSGTVFTAGAVNTRYFRGNLTGFPGMPVGCPAHCRQPDLIILSQE